MTRPVRAVALCLCALVVVGSATADQRWNSVARASTAPPRPSGDLLLFRQRTRMNGTLVGCGGAAYPFNGGNVDRGRIELIGLSGAVLPPPHLDDPGVTTLFLSGGEVGKKSLVGVNTHEAGPDAGSYPRADVRWIPFASPGGQEGEQEATPKAIIAATPPSHGQETGGPGATPPGPHAASTDGPSAHGRPADAPSSNHAGPSRYASAASLPAAAGRRHTAARRSVDRRCARPLVGRQT